MRDRRNLVATYGSQLYVALIGIFVVPVLIKILGPESYGLIGFYAMLQVWFGILDLGMSQSISRETARYLGGKSSAMAYRRLARALEGVFLAIALIGGTSLFLSARAIAINWLSLESIESAEVVYVIQMAAIIISLRWTTGLYRGIVIGSQRLFWLAVNNTVFATLRFVAVIPLLIYVEPTIRFYFSWQMAIAILEALVLITKSYSILPRLPSGVSLRWEWSPLKPVLIFSLSIAFTSSVWAMVTQVDKLVLSGLLDLADYGYFTLAVLAASTITMLSNPIGTVLMPRLARYEAEGNSVAFVKSYRAGTQIAVMIAGSASITVAFMAKPLLLAWTGQPDFVLHVAPILTLYALGNGFLALSAFPYYLQFAKGNMRLHLIGSLIFLFLLVPLISWGAWAHGAEGAAWVWFSLNAIITLTWPKVVHQKFIPRLNAPWYRRDLLLPIVPMFMCGWVLSGLFPTDGSRLLMLFITVLTGLVVLSVSALTYWVLKRRSGEIFLSWS